MAALLFKCCFEVPCKACGTVCKPCAGCAEDACGAVNEFCCSPERPSPVFLTYTALLAGLPGLAALFYGVTNLGDADCSNLGYFLLGQFALSALWVGFAVHLYRQFSKPYTATQDDSNFSSRCCRLWLYDPYVLVMFFVFFASIAWPGVGLRWLDDKEEGECDADLESMVNTSAVLMFVYVGFGAAILWLSMICECCRSTSPLPAYRGAGAAAAPAARPRSALWYGGSLVGGLLFPQLFRTHKAPAIPVSAPAPGPPTTRPPPPPNPPVYQTPQPPPYPAYQTPQPPPYSTQAQAQGPVLGHPPYAAHAPPPAATHGSIPVSSGAAQQPPYGQQPVMAPVMSRDHPHASTSGGGVAQYPATPAEGSSTQQQGGQSAAASAALQVGAAVGKGLYSGLTQLGQFASDAAKSRNQQPPQGSTKL